MPDDMEPTPLADFRPLMAWRVAISETDGLLALILVDANDKQETFFFPPAVADEISERLAVNAHALRSALGLPPVPPTPSVG